jgi:hypothetical protein
MHCFIDLGVFAGGGPVVIFLFAKVEEEFPGITNMAIKLILDNHHDALA